MHRSTILNVLALLGLLLAATMAVAGGFNTIDMPGATDTGLYCVNALGDLCGSWTDSSGAAHGLVIASGGQAKTFDFPTATATYVIDMNRAGDRVGLYDNPTDHAWMQLQGQGAVSIDPPSSKSAIARGINDSGVIVGGYRDASGTMHGFVRAAGAYQAIDYPQSTSTDAWGIDGAGDVVGQYTGTDGSTHGFLLKGGAFSPIDFPGAQFTIADRVTDDGRILGFYTLADNTGHGFLLSNGAYTSIDVPGASATRSRGLNAAGEIAGAYTDAAGHTHGFTTTVQSLVQSASADVTGSFGGSSSTSVHGTFHCSGYPTCVGSYSQQLQDSGCSNAFTQSGGFTMTGLDLSKPGNIGGTLTAQGSVTHDTRQADGSCILNRPSTDLVTTYTGSWDGANGTIAVAGPPDASGAATTIPGAFKADLTMPPPVFPMVVSGGIDASVGNVAAQIQFRPEDVGTPSSVFVFAIAPSTLVKDATKSLATSWKAVAADKDTPVQCVLAQLGASGQLHGVSASSLQAYISGVLQAGWQAVTILNGVPTVNIAGATFYVGYGSSGTTMINGGVNRSAVTAPGSVVCKPDAPQKGWWWNPLEDGRGYSIEVHGNNIFFASFLYDTSGRSTWYVSTGRTSLDGSLYVGDLLAAAGGQTLGGAYPGFPQLGKAGAITLTFSDVSHGTMVWPGGAVPMQRFNMIPNGLAIQNGGNTPESGWWWNPNESGRGFFMEWQGTTLDIAGYMYDDQGNPVWYLTYLTASDPSGAIGHTVSGNWWSYADGQTLTGAWKPNRQVSNNVAPVTIQFLGPDSAIMTLPNGRTTALQRQRF